MRPGGKSRGFFEDVIEGAFGCVQVTRNPQTCRGSPRSQGTNVPLRLSKALSFPGVN